MASSNLDSESTSMFMQKGDGKESKKSKSPTRSEPTSRRNSIVKASIPAEIITVKDFFDFMKTAYQVYEHLEGDEEEGSKINWEELTKLTVINHVIEQGERDLLVQTAFTEPQPNVSKSDSALEKKNKELEKIEKRFSCSQLEGKCNRRRSLPPEVRVEMLGVWTEANLNCKLNDVINEGILDSILPYLVGYKKQSKTTSVYTPVIKKVPSNTNTDVKKPASFGGFVNEKESRDRLGRRKSSVIAAQERGNQKQDGDVEIHVCDEVKGLKKDFRCPQKLLVSKMGYFADVTAGQRLEDMDISVHCDIQIFDWLMRWVKRDTILVADWPLLDPHNVVPILVSASFLQMEPLLHDCLIYCHAHMSDIVKTSTNLACLSDALLTRLAAMYTNAELEAIRDRKDKVQSRLYCKLILSLGEPVPETLRGHYASLATLFKCSKCSKLLGRHIAEQVPCQPASMRIDRRGNVVSAHNKDPAWSLNDYISWLYGELRSWRRVYWRLWADCHFLRCQLCDSHFPAYQMEWCSHHEQSAHMFALEGRPPLPAGRYPCCGERAYRFETLTRNTGCQFREHVPDERLATDAAVMEMYGKFRDIIAMRPPQLVFPERLTRLVTRASARPGSPTLGAARTSCQSLAASTAELPKDPRPKDPRPPRDPRPPKAATVRDQSPRIKTGAAGGDPVSCDEEQSSSSDESEQSGSARSDEDAPPPRPALHTPQHTRSSRRPRVVGRQWAASLSARSNQDGQRRFEERAARQMRAALGRHARVAHTAPAQTPTAHGRAKCATPPGGAYARLEAEWRERHGGGGGAGATRTRHAASARTRAPNNAKYK